MRKQETVTLLNIDALVKMEGLNTAHWNSGCDDYLFKYT